MKGIVVENIDRDSIILTEDGLFKKVKNNNYIVGQTVKIKDNMMFSKLAAGAASLAAAFVICTVGAYAYFTPSDYVSMDVNPSIEYSLNMFDRVLNVKAVNDDGEEILAQLELKNKNIDKALKETLDKLIEEGYLTDDPDGGVIIATSNKDVKEAEKLAAHLEKNLQEYIDEHEDVTAKVDAEAVGLERVEEARGLGITPGKLNLYQKLVELQIITDGAITSKDDKLYQMSVKEINKAIKEENKKLKEQEKDQTKQNDKLDTDSSDDDEASVDAAPGNSKLDVPASENAQNQKKTDKEDSIDSDDENGTDKVKEDKMKEEKVKENNSNKNKTTEEE